MGLLLAISEKSLTKYKLFKLLEAFCHLRINGRILSGVKFAFSLL